MGEVAPAAPTNLNALVLSASSIDLSWNAAVGASLYRIQRKGPGETAFTDYRSTTSNLFYDTGLTAAGIYTYQVRAENSGGVSAYGDAVSKTTFAATPAAAPAARALSFAAAPSAAASVAALDYQSVDINLKPSGSTSIVTPGPGYDVTAGGDDIYGSSDSLRFVYAERTGNFDVKVQVTGISKAASKSKGGLMVRELLTEGSRTVFSGVTNSSGYRFGSRTTNKGNFANNYTSGTPSYPNNVWVRLKRIGNVFTGYRSSDGVNWTQMGSINISLPQTVYFGLATASTTKSATTVAKYRNLGDVAAPAPLAPATPTGLNVQATGPSQINVTWNAVSGATYRIQRQGPAETSFTDWKTSTTGSITDTNLTANSTYAYKIRAESGSLTSAYTAAMGATTDAIVVTPSVPTNFNVSPLTSSQINLSWDAMANATLYRLQRKAPGEAAFSNFATTTKTRFSDAGLAPNSPYSYQVRAENGAVASEYSPPLQTNTLAPSAPAAPSNLNVVAASTTQIDVTWDAVLGATLYQLQRKGPGDSDFTDYRTTTGTVIHESGLDGGKNYAFQVRGEDSGVPGNYSAPAEVNTGLTVPANVNAQAVSPSEIDLTWNPVSGATRYRIQRRALGEQSFTDYATVDTGTTLHDQTLNEASTYSYQVRAENDEGGLSPYTAPQTRATPAIPVAPATPGNFNAVATGPTQVNLSWNASSGTTLYRVQRQGPGNQDLVELTTSGTLLTDTSVTANAAYSFSVRAENGPPLVSDYTGVKVVNTPAVPALSSVDIGSTGGTTAVVTNGVDYTVTSSGADIYNNTDSFRFVYKTVTSDFDIQVKISDLSTGDDRNKAGLMVRESLAAGSRSIFGGITARDGYRFATRTSTNGSTTNEKGNAPQAPAWVRLRRTGNTFTAYQSTDGVTWTQFGQTTITLPSTLYFGLATCAQKGAPAATATYQSLGAGSPSTLPAAQTHVNWANGTDAPFARQETISIEVGSKLFVWGGFIDQDLNVTNTGYVQDLATGKWKSVADTPLCQTHAGITTDGTNIYMAGGQLGPHDSDNAHAECFKYNIAADKWSSFTSLPDARLGGGLGYMNGFLYFMGGDISDRVTVSDKTFAIPVNESTGWVDKNASMPDPVDHFSVAELNGRIYAVGGDTDHGFSYISHDSVRYYDPATNTWTVVASMPTPASHFETATMVVNGRIVAIGGQAPDVELMNEVRAYDPAMDKWTVLEHIPDVRKGGIAYSYGGKIFYTSGRAETTSGGHVNSKTTYVGTLTNAG